MTTLVEVRLWGRTIGAASLDPGERFALFQYDPDFAGSGIELSPLVMPLSRRVHRFADLSVQTFRGLPGLLADSLPDRFGDRLIAAWLARQGRTADDFNALERLCYVGTRGMGALEFAPAIGPRSAAAERIHVDALVGLAAEVLADRGAIATSFEDTERERALGEILRVGTSAGGARAKAVIVWNQETDEVRSGQGEAPPGFQHWLLKFDGVQGNRDKELDDPLGFCAVEYAYSLMARAAGISMPETRLLEEGGRRHFMARRFDRTAAGERLHMQSLGALAHLDFNDPNAHSYEEAFLAIRRLGLPMDDVEEQYRRMAFNVVARNQDDHVKNIAFLMDRRGRWSLAPAFDLTYAYNPVGAWTGRHQMSVAGKHDDFTRSDLRACARSAGMKRGRADTILDEVRAAVIRWDEWAAAGGVAESHARRIALAHRREIPA